MRYKKQIKKVVFSHFAECNDHDTRQSDHLGTTWEHAFPSAMAIANITDLPSAMGQALGKGLLFAECLVGDTRHSGHLCRVSKSMVLGKSGTFAECLTLTLGKAAVTATFLCRVPDIVHSAKRSLPINCLPSALCRVYIGLCRVPQALGKESASGSVIGAYTVRLLSSRTLV